MKIYLVGGAVRDKLLGKPVHDKDYVVIGATPDEMVALGFKQVGKSFPVFLHPETNEEYALARKEIKTGKGHKDFEFVFTPDVSLKEDSLRRDFTCNAIYQDIESKEIIDYHQGIDDIQKKVLRHVSEHFEEDPLRVLRMCRFAAQLDFSVAPETMDLCQKMVKDGALKNLSKERIWQELEKALSSKTFYHFIEVARECGALEVILPEVEQLFSIPERIDYHPEKNSGAHTLLALKAADSNDPMLNFAVLMHDIGKIKTDPTCWPSHRGHDEYGPEIIKNIGKRLHIPTSFIEFASLTAENHMIYHRKINEVQKKIVQICVKLMRYRQREYLNKFISVLRADKNGRGKPASAEETETFEKFAVYIEKLANTICLKKPSDLPEFDCLIEGIKKGTIDASKLEEAYINAIVKATPLTE